VQPKWFGVGAMAVGLVIMCVPYRYTVPFEDETGVIEARATCVPLRDLFKRAPDGGWFGYAPDTRSVHLASSFCGPTARRRAALGVFAMVAGAGVLLWARRRSRSDRRHR
jgi:hypothetical protein